MTGEIETTFFLGLHNDLSSLREALRFAERKLRKQSATLSYRKTSLYQRASFAGQEKFSMSKNHFFLNCFHCFICFVSQDLGLVLTGYSHKP